MANFLGIDPGLNGAFAILAGDRVLRLDELPRFGKILNVSAWLADSLTRQAIDLAVIEQVGPMPKQGVVSVFTFGCAYGACLGTLAALRIPTQLVPPQAWKKHFSLLRKPKDASRELATRFYPDIASELKLKKHHGRADALLLARYAQTLGEVV